MHARIQRRFTRDMPLGGIVNDYNAYWQRREVQMGDTSPPRAYHRNFIAAQLIPEGAKVLDVGCGPGKLLEVLCRHRPDLSLHGVDISSQAVQLANDIREHLRFWTVEDFRVWAKAGGLAIEGIHATHKSALRRRYPSLLASQIVYDLRLRTST